MTNAFLLFIFFFNEKRPLIKDQVIYQLSLQFSMCPLQMCLKNVKKQILTKSLHAQDQIYRRSFSLYSSCFILQGGWHFQAAKGYLDLIVHPSFSLLGFKIHSEPSPKEWAAMGSLAGSDYSSTGLSWFFLLFAHCELMNLLLSFCSYSWKLRSQILVGKPLMVRSAWIFLSLIRMITGQCLKKDPILVMSWRDPLQVSPCQSCFYKQYLKKLCIDKNIITIFCSFSC